MERPKEPDLIIRDACEKAGIETNDKMLCDLYKYYELLVCWNEKINLTAITEIRGVYVKHFADSIFGSEMFDKGATVCDIGTGAGFPGLVLKIVRPDLKVILIDSLDKRIKFLKLVIDELKLEGIEALHYRAEDKAFKEQYLNSIDFTTARAVARMNTLIEYCLPYVKVGGKFVAYKSDKIDDELIEAKTALKILGGESFETKEYQLDKETKRYLVIAKKVSKTDKKYPRDMNKPKLKPL
ncbi:MAG: 16S rRNA (guanine(527)-N(7))-methyltransferase RsmG [Clostridiales bacterium]|nr:16S rRNA (guanine(527)-N(7))-methyltransferase RsmG [Candidatus Apopatousia equi]